MAHLHETFVPAAAVVCESAWVLCVDEHGHGLWLSHQTLHEVVDLAALNLVGEVQHRDGTRVLGDPLAAFVATLAGMGEPPERGRPL